jgi:hypothetical protein
MPIDSRAKAFIEANIEHYREVTGECPVDRRK